MKVKRTDAHDRLLEFNKQSGDISQGCLDCINSRPEEFGSHPFYIFAHKREIGTDERVAIYNLDFYDSLKDLSYRRKYKSIEEVPSARLIWEPRFTKPTAQQNSMLFKAYPGTDNIKVIWMIPAPELWEQYQKGNMTESKIICESIYDLINNPRKLDQPEDDDLSDEAIKQIYTQIAKNAKKTKII